MNPFGLGVEGVVDCLCISCGDDEGDRYNRGQKHRSRAGTRHFFNRIGDGIEICESPGVQNIRGKRYMRTHWASPTSYGQASNARRRSLGWASTKSHQLQGSSGLGARSSRDPPSRYQWPEELVGDSKVRVVAIEVDLLATVE